MNREVKITSGFVSLYAVVFYVCFSLAELNNLSLTVQVYFAEGKNLQSYGHISTWQLSRSVFPYFLSAHRSLMAYL